MSKRQTLILPVLMVMWICVGNLLTLEGGLGKSLMDDTFIRSLQAKRDEMRRSGVTGKIPYRGPVIS